MATISNCIQTALIGAIRTYRYALSLLIGHCCRFEPTCSVYAMTAIEKYGTLKGCRLTFSRIICCHPWHPGGTDPLP